MAMRVQSLDRALPAIAGFITDRTGIPVIRGSEAKTDNRAIYLPRRQSELDLTDKELVMSVGFVYHESSHLRYSNFSLKATSPLQEVVTGVLEDIRIEHLAMGEFPGARRYLSRLMQFLIEDGAAGLAGFPTVEGSEAESVILQRYMVYRLRHEVLRQEPMAELAAGAIAAARQRLPVGMLTRLDALMFEVVNCKSEDEVFELADAIISMIKEEKEKEREKKEQQESCQQDGQDEGQADGQQQGPSPSNATGSGDQDGQQQGPSPSNATGSGDQDGQQQGQPDQPSGTDDQDDPAAQGARGVGSGADMEQALEQLLSMSGHDVQQGVGEMLQQAINAAAATQRRDGASVPVPYVYKACLTTVPVDLAALRASINATRTRTLQWMSSVAEGEVLHSRSGMQIDPSRIWQGRFGGQIFVREDDGIDLNGAVSIVIDRSGSMKRTIGHAVQAAVATMLAFDVPGLKTQVSVFPWSGAEGQGVAVIKRWEEKASHLAGRVAGLSAAGSTPMAEAILFAASEVARREETLKMVMVITDGDPNDVVGARYMIDRARADGIAVVGLGIGVDTSSLFGEAYAATISNIGELSASMVKLVKASFEANHQMR